MEKMPESDTEEKKKDYLEEELKKFESGFSDQDNEDLQLSLENMEEFLKDENPLSKLPPKLITEIFKGFGLEQNDNLQEDLGKIMQELQQLEKGMKAGKTPTEIQKELEEGK